MPTTPMAIASLRSEPVSTDRPKSKGDPRQMRLGFEAQRVTPATLTQPEHYCDTCKRWVPRDMFDLFHPPGHPVRPWTTSEREHDDDH